MKRIWCLGFLLIGSTVFARFISVDPKREYWNSYSYVGNNPIIAIDKNGEETFFVQGTRMKAKDIESYIRNAITRTLNDVDGGYEFPGRLGLNERAKAAKHLFQAIRALHERDPSEPINLVGHSHGGNVFLGKTFKGLIQDYNANNADNPISIDNVILLNTPVRSDATPDFGIMKNVVLISVQGDKWQKAGGAVPGFGKAKIKDDRVINIFVDRKSYKEWFAKRYPDQKVGYRHTMSISDPDFWNTFVAPVLEKQK